MVESPEWGGKLKRYSMVTAPPVQKAIAIDALQNN